MKKINYLIILIVSAIAFLSCQKEENLKTEENSVEQSDNPVLVLSPAQLDELIQNVNNLENKIFKIPVKRTENPYTKGIDDSGRVTLDRLNQTAKMTEDNIVLGSYCTLSIDVTLNYTTNYFDDYIYLMTGDVFNPTLLYTRTDIKAQKYDASTSTTSIAYYILRDNWCSIVVNTTDPTTGLSRKVKISFELQITWYTNKSTCDMLLFNPRTEIL